MKKLLAATMLCMASWASGQDVMMQRTKGDVTVRHGVAETWNVVAAGDVLKPDDTIRTGKKGSAVLLVDKTKRIELPSNVIVDVSDIRELSQEELMLKLTMEKVRASSYEWKNDQMNIPNAPIVHGEDRTPTRLLTENQLEVGKSEWNGTKVLYDNGYYPTSALKAMDVLRRYPPLGKSFENRLLIAEALERSDLRGEALNEYVTLSQSGTLTGNQKELVQSRIAQLRRQTDR